MPPLAPQQSTAYISGVVLIPSVLLQQTMVTLNRSFPEILIFRFFLGFLSLTKLCLLCPTVCDHCPGGPSGAAPHRCLPPAHHGVSAMPRAASCWLLARVVTPNLFVRVTLESPFMAARCGKGVKEQGKWNALRKYAHCIL